MFAYTYLLPLQQSHSFFKLLSMLTEMQGGPPGMPSFTNLTLARIWEVRVVTITYHFRKKIWLSWFYFNITPVHLLALYKTKGLFHLFSHLLSLSSSPLSSIYMFVNRYYSVNQYCRGDKVTSWSRISLRFQVPLICDK